MRHLCATWCVNSHDSKQCKPCHHVGVRCVVTSTLHCSAPHCMAPCAAYLTVPMQSRCNHAITGMLQFTRLQSHAKSRKVTTPCKKSRKSHACKKRKQQGENAKNDKKSRKSHAKVTRKVTQKSRQSHAHFWVNHEANVCTIAAFFVATATVPLVASPFSSLSVGFWVKRMSLLQSCNAVCIQPITYFVTTSCLA